MTNLHPVELTTVVGGATKTKKDDLTLQLTTLTSSLKDLASHKDNGNTSMMTMMMMAMAMRPQPTVVAAGAAGPVASGAVINIRTRFGHR